MTAISDQISVEAEDVAEASDAQSTQTAESESVAYTDREVLDSLMTLNYRNLIYKTLFQAMEDHPRILLLGSEDGTIMSLMGEYKDFLTVHNAYLQVLALTGVVGLLLILALCVFVFLAALKLILDERKTMAQRVLPVVMVPLVLQAVTESILFVPWTTLGPGTLINFVFLLSAGYTVEMAGGLKFKELFQAMK